MVRLLAMVLTAFDPRRNPAVACLLRLASQQRDSLVQYAQSYGAMSASGAYYTKNHETMPSKTRPPRLVKAFYKAGGELRLACYWA